MRRKRRTRTSAILIAVMLLAVAAGVAGYWWIESRSPAAVPVSDVPVADEPPAAQPDPPAPRYPVEHVVVQRPTETESPPELVIDESTGAREILSRLVADAQSLAVVRDDALIERFVATLDNLPRRELAQRLTPWSLPDGRFAVERDGGSVFVGTANRQRYEPYVQAFLAIDPERALQAYEANYERLQTAWRELGYKDGYFNDRVVAVLDDLLATPQSPARPRLARPNVVWTYEDRELEQASIGQRLLLRLDAETRNRVRERLARYREALAGERQSGRNDGGTGDETGGEAP